MPASAYVSHALPGRVRLRLPQRRGDAEFFARLAATLAAAPGVQEARANALTATVLLRHSGELAQIARYAAECGLFTLVALEDMPVPIGEALRSAARGLDRELRRASAGYLDLPALAFLGLLGLAAWQWQRGQVLGPAATLLWYAASLAGGMARAADHRSVTVAG